MEVSFASKEEDQIIVTRFTQGGKEIIDTNEFDIFIGSNDQDIPTISEMDPNIEYNQALEIYLSTLKKWIHQNNLSFFYNLFFHLKELNQLFNRFREDGFKLLWHLLRKNIGSHSLILIFNRLEKKKTRNILIPASYQGRTNCELIDADDALINTLEEYQDTDNAKNWNADKKELTLKFVTVSGPVLILAKLWEDLTPMQHLLLKQLADGLNSSSLIN